MAKEKTDGILKSSKKNLEQSSSVSDTFCIICLEPYSESASVEIWRWCIICKSWAHKCCVTSSIQFKCPNGQQLDNPLAKLLARCTRLDRTRYGSGNHSENYSSISATNQKCINGIFKASLFEWNFVLFKILQVKNIPALHYKRAYFRRGWAQAMRPQSNLLQFMLKVAFN